MGREVEQYKQFENELRESFNEARARWLAWQTHKDILCKQDPSVLTSAFSAICAGSWEDAKEVLVYGQYKQYGVYELRQLCQKRGIAGASRMSRVTMERMLRTKGETDEHSGTSCTGSLEEDQV